VDGFAIAQAKVVVAQIKPGPRARAARNGFDQVWRNAFSILRLTMLPAMHAIIELDDIELSRHSRTDSISFQQHRGPATETGGGQGVPRKGFFQRDAFFHFQDSSRAQWNRR